MNGSGAQAASSGDGAALDGARLLWPDLVRAYAIASVFLLHCASVPNTQFSRIPMETWWQTNIYQAFLGTCIPLFIMLSGALLLEQKRWDANRFRRKRLAKVLLPYGRTHRGVKAAELL